MFHRLGDIGILYILIAAIMRLYAAVLGCLCVVHGLTYFIRSTIGVK